MNISPETWPTLNALLDEALRLPAEARESWVVSLPGEHAALKDTLRELLSRASGVETEDFLATLPRFTGVAASGPLSELAAGDAIGPYRLLSELGSGGMGSVWLAERADGALKRQVALKLPRMVWAKGLAERMARERDILATLEHPNIARLYDAGVDQHGRPYLALEYVEGQPIDVYVKERGLSVRHKLELLLQVCAAVAFAHSRLVVHRDLKPSNILVTADGHVRLLDFGIAKLMEGDSAQETQLTHLAGRALTLDYASPEQIKGEPIGTASDVYSLGVVAYELLAGAKPYRLKRGSAAELEEAIANAEPPRASEATGDLASKRALRGDLDAILNKVLKKDPGERYGTVDALAADWQRYLARQPVTARADSALYRLSKLIRRYPAPVGSAAAVVLAIVLGASAALEQRNRALEQADTARREAARAAAVRDLLIDLFKSNSVLQPSAEAAQNMTARQLLELGTQKVDKLAQSAPDAHAYLLRLFGDLHDELSLLDQALVLHERSAVAARRAFGERSGEVALADLHLAQAVMRKGDPKRAQELVETAKSLLEEIAPNTAELGQALYFEARVFLYADPPRAEQAAHRAVRTLDAVEPNGERAADARFLLGLVKQTRGQPLEAVQAYREARQRYAALFGADSNPASATWAAEARMLMVLSRWEEAATAIDESLKVLGTRGDVIDRCATLIAKARLELARGRGASSEAALEEALQARARVPDKVAFPTSAALHGYLGSMILRRGDAQRAVTHLESGLRDLPGDDTVSRMRFLATLATAELQAGNVARAQASYDDVRQILAQRGSAPAAIRELIAEAGAMLAAYRSDELELRKQLEEARIANTSHAGREHAALQARAWSVMKRSNEVRAAVASHVPTLLALSDGNFDAVFDAELALLAAEALMEEDPPTARALLRKVEPFMKGALVPASAGLRRLRQLKVQLS